MGRRYIFILISYACMCCLIVNGKFYCHWFFHQASPPTTASFLCAYRDTEHGCKFSKRRNVFDKKLAQEDKKSPCANALLQVTNTI
ncbi:hypothetical protein FQJ29_01450 [Escherichia coli]|nr:hypothetical protein [Escherichia coli]